MNIISKTQLDTANLAVTRELSALGFWDEAMAATDTYLTFAGYAYGYQMYEGSGEILIPSISINRLSEKLLKLKRATLRDILRHEFAHAFAHTHPGLVKNKAFEKVFGGPHELDTGLEQVYDPAFHVTEYAASMPMEDFAEVFMLYVKHKGQIPEAINRPAIRKKWNFVGKLPDKLKQHNVTRPPAPMRSRPGKTRVPDPQSSDSVKLKVKTTQQRDGHNCGAHAVTALLRYHGWVASLREIKDALGSEHHILPPVPGRAKVERLLDSMNWDTRGTLPFDLFFVLWNYRFTTRLLPLSSAKLKTALYKELSEKRPVLGIIWNGAYLHWLVITGMDDEGVWVADSLEADTPQRMDWEDVETDLIGAIAASPQEDLLVSAMTRSVTCTAIALQRIVKRAR